MRSCRSCEKGVEMEQFFRELTEVLNKIQNMQQAHGVKEIMSIAVSADGYAAASIYEGGNTYNLTRCTYKDSYTYSVGKELEKNDNAGMH